MKNNTYEQIKGEVQNLQNSIIQRAIIRDEYLLHDAKNYIDLIYKYSFHSNNDEEVKEWFKIKDVILLSNLHYIKNQIEVMSEARKIAKDQNKTVIMVIHDLNMAKKYSDKIVLMNKGKVIDFGASEDVLNCKNIKKVYGVDTDIINGYIIPK